MSMSMMPVDPGSVDMSAARLADAAALMQRQYDEGLSPALVAVVARQGKVVFSHAVGEQRPGGPPVTVESVFPLASQTKPMTAAVIMCLVERGLIGLNEPASLTLPEFGEENADVMVQNLLSHTSGWHEDDHLESLADRLDEAIESIPEGGDALSHILLWCGWDVPRRLPTDELMQYCNFNYCALGEMIRRVSGGTLDAAMREYLFEPLGMTGTTVIMDEKLRRRLVERPLDVPGGPEHPDTRLAFNDPVWLASDDGASGAHGSVTDFVRFQQMFLDGGKVGDSQVISKDAVRVMTTNQIPGTSAELSGLRRGEASWAYGFGVAGHEPWPRYGGGTLGPDAIRHGGAGGMCGWIDPDRNLVAGYFEVLTEADDGFPVSWAAQRFEDVVTSAILT